MSVKWEEVLSVLMNGTGINLNLDIYNTNFIIKESDYFRQLGSLLAEFRMNDISASYTVISN
jgi:hypothetical protein